MWAETASGFFAFFLPKTLTAHTTSFGVFFFFFARLDKFASFFFKSEEVLEEVVY